MPGHTKCCTCHAKSSQATPIRKSAPGPPNSSDEHVSCIAPASENASLQILFKCPTPAIVFGNATKPSRFAHFWQGPQSLAPATRNDIRTSKSGANMWCFQRFDFEMCFAPQRRTQFDIATSKSDPELVCFVHFDLEMCFVPKRRAIFHIWPDGSAPAALASLLFEPLEPQIIGKTQCFATFLPFRAPASSFFWLFLFSDLLSSALLFSVLLLHLCFSSVHIVGSLTSKLPSIICWAGHPKMVWVLTIWKLGM